MRPMFATPGRLPVGSRWRYEVSWTGLRVLVEVSDGALRLTAADQRDVTARFPELGELAGRLRDGVLDGEIVIMDGAAPSMTEVRRRLAGQRTAPASLLVFDVLRLYGVSLLQRPFEERRATLERTAVDSVGGVALSPVYDDGPALLSATRKHRLAGVVAKHADSPYRPGVRDASWVAVAAS